MHTYTFHTLMMKFNNIAVVLVMIITNCLALSVGYDLTYHPLLTYVIIFSYLHQFTDHHRSWKYCLHINFTAIVTN